jgi:hypothetical protein
MVRARAAVRQGKTKVRFMGRVLGVIGVVASNRLWSLSKQISLAK